MSGGKIPFGYLYRIVVGEDHPSAQAPWRSEGTVFEAGPAPTEGVCGHVQYLNLYHPAPASEVSLADEPSQYCYSPDHGDSWYDSPDDAAILDYFEADHIGATFELQVSHWSVNRTFRVTKIPDDASDDYEVEAITAAQQESQP